MWNKSLLTLLNGLDMNTCLRQSFPPERPIHRRSLYYCTTGALEVVTLEGHLQRQTHKPLSRPLYSKRWEWEWACARANPPISPKCHILWGRSVHVYLNLFSMHVVCSSPSHVEPQVRTLRRCWSFSHCFSISTSALIRPWTDGSEVELPVWETERQQHWCKTQTTEGPKTCE